MHIFGLEITRKSTAGLSPVYDSRGSWFPWRIHEPFTGAWQRNKEWTTDSVLANSAVFACITLIAQDIGKLRPKLVERTADGIWTETTSPAFSPVLKKPNAFQTRIQFVEWWMTSKLSRGNTYAFKEYDARGVVRALYLLDPSRVKVLVAPDGSVFYDLGADNLAGLGENTIVPASAIIHDRMNCLFHPLVGVSPIFACGVAANVGLRIQESSVDFFAKGANPSGVVTVPGPITQEQADRISLHWNYQFQGENAGKVAVLPNGMTFTPMSMSSADSQLVEQLRMTAETVCSTFHVPPFKIGIGAMPTYPNAAEALNQIYYSDCLQSLIESFELCMDEGLAIGLGEAKEGKTLGVELDLENLIRMDTGAQVTALTTAIGGGLMTPNEARRRVELKPLTGGDTVYLQQQDFAMYAIHERDQAKPFSKPTPPTAPAVTPTPPRPNEDPASETDPDDEDSAPQRRALVDLYEKAIAA